MLKALSLFTLFAMLPIGVSAQTATRQNQVTGRATVAAINRVTRSMTLRADNGDEDTFAVGPKVPRLDQINVGDTIMAIYYESLVLELRKLDAADAPSAGGRLTGKPGGAIGTPETITVTVKAVNVRVPSITVATSNFQTLTRKVADRRHLDGVAPGDRVEITCLQGVVIAAESSRSIPGEEHF